MIIVPDRFRHRRRQLIRRFPIRRRRNAVRHFSVQHVVLESYKEQCQLLGFAFVYEWQGPVSLHLLL